MEPFNGVVFVHPQPLSSKHYKGPLFCKSIGRGKHEVKIEVGVGQCGWRRKGEKVELKLYVQYDAHIRQSIDEKLSVECDMANSSGRIKTYQNRHANASLNTEPIEITVGKNAASRVRTAKFS